ncbi:MAG: hypothetical protein U9N49_02370 [Campylobacterota bacterium]|nr:hypothetical protein [Campylobacterota bacterium]
MANNNNRANQLNPTSKEFLDSRGCSLTQEDVSKIQRAEVKSKSCQTSDGIGAEAQRRLENIKNGGCKI